MKMEIKPIGIVENDFDDKFAVPRQSGIADIKSKVILNKEYSSNEAIRGIDGFSHLWLIWEFDKNSHEATSLTVRPPRLGGNKRVGVFASRSPFRPNPIGLSSVRLDGIEWENDRLCLIVSGADIVNGTPIYDIKPYIKFSDSHDDAISGYVEDNEFNMLEVNIPPTLLDKISDDKINTLITILQNDPRPAYKRDDEKEYGFKFAKKEIKFRVKGSTLTVTDIIDE